MTDYTNVLVGERQYKRVYFMHVSKLEQRMQRKLQHPQSAHLTSEEQARLTPRDLARIAAAAAKRTRKNGIRNRFKQPTHAETRQD